VKVIWDLFALFGIFAACVLAIFGQAAYEQAHQPAPATMPATYCLPEPGSEVCK